MDTGESFCFAAQGEPKKEVKLLTLACRFVPYDQWLVTHVDSSWTIKEVKAWILAKCIANNTSVNAPAQSPQLPPINPPAKPKTKPARRPASPIVFAEFGPSDRSAAHNPGDGPILEEKYNGKKRRGRGRPISPITFAPIGGLDSKRGSDDDDLPALRDAEGEVIGMGYEEDDEWDSEDDSDVDDIEHELDSRLGRRANRNQYMGYHDRLSRPLPNQQSALPTNSRTTSASKPLPVALPKGSFSTYHPNLLTLIRFSTGQILEKHFTILDYEIKPYELIEIHRLGVITKLPREVTFKYIEPYWEGWVKALRVVFREPRVVAEARLQARDEASRRREERSYRVLDTKRLDSSYAESARRTMDVLSGGPVRLAPADVALGLRQAPSRTRSAKKTRRSIGNEQDLFSTMVKPNSTQNGALLGRSATGPLSKPSTSHTSGSLYRSKGKLEWRERWIFIKDGVLHLKKENSDSSSSTMQTLPLSSLTEVRGADQLGGKAMSIPPSPSQRIVCAKFKTRMTTTKSPTPESSYHVPSHVRNPDSNAVPSSSNRSIAKSSINSSKSASTLSKPLSSSTSRGGTSHPGNGSISGLPLGLHNVSTSSRAATSVHTQARSTIASISKPKIALQISPVSPSAKAFQSKQRTPLSIISDKDKDKGKGKAPAKSSLNSSSKAMEVETEVPSGPPSEAVSECFSDALTDGEGAASDNEANADDFDDEKKRKKKKRPKQQQMSPQRERRHPTIAMESDADDGSGGTLSSPVFAHSDDDSPFSDEPGLRSYGYGHSHFGGTELRKRRSGKVGIDGGKERGVSGQEDDENPEVDSSYVAVSVADVGDAPIPKEKVRRPSTHSRHSVGSREKTDPESEWIVLDLGDDFAFKSFLRVIHRHAPHVIDSSFLSTLPSFQMPKPSSDSVPAAPAPTPTFTPPPTSPVQAVSFGQWSWNAARQMQDCCPTIEEISPIDNPLSKEASPAAQSSSSSISGSTIELASLSKSDSVGGTPAGTQTPVPSPPAAPRDSKQYRLPPSPTYGAPMGMNSTVLNFPHLHSKQSETKKITIQSSMQKKAIGTYGAVPYPEWRLEVVTKAQRAGMGDLSKAMDQFLWSDNPGLALLSRELGLSLAPMEFIRSPSIQSTIVSDRVSPDDGEDNTEDATSTWRQKKRRERKLTLEQENIAMGLELTGSGFPGIDRLESNSTLVDCSRQKTSPPVNNDSEEPSPSSTLHTIRVHTHGSINSPLRLGHIDVDSSESGEESSDAEWLGWMADLHRQAKLQREDDLRRDRLETASVASSADTYHYWDYQQQDDHRRYQQERKALEPSAVVTSSPPSTMPNSPTVGEMSQYGHTSSVSTNSGSSISRAFGDIVGGSSVLTSPSSNESLGQTLGRRLSFGLSPSEPPSSSTSPSLSQVGYNTVEVSYHENQYSGSRSVAQHRSAHSRGGPHLSHYASTGLIGLGSLESAREMEFNGNGPSLTSARRPSMPTLSSSSSDRLTPPPMQSFSSVGTGSSWWPMENSTAISGSRSRSPATTSNPAPVTIPGRMSATGLSSAPLVRSSSLMGKGPGLLRKRTTVKEADDDQDREMRQSKGKHKEKHSKEKGKERSPDPTVQVSSGDTRSRRPRLSVSTGDQAYNQASNSEAASPPATTTAFTGRIIRHIRSSQSLLSGEEVNRIARNSSPPKKKKGGMVRERAEKFLQGLESTLDFVDAR